MQEVRALNKGVDNFKKFASEFLALQTQGGCSLIGLEPAVKLIDSLLVEKEEQVLDAVQLFLSRNPIEVQDDSQVESLRDKEGSEATLLFGPHTRAKARAELMQASLMRYF